MSNARRSTQAEEGSATQTFERNQQPHPHSRPSSHDSTSTPPQPQGAPEHFPRANGLATNLAALLSVRGVRAGGSRAERVRRGDLLRARGEGCQASVTASICVSCLRAAMIDLAHPLLKDTTIFH